MRGMRARRWAAVGAASAVVGVAGLSGAAPAVADGITGATVASVNKLDGTPLPASGLVIYNETANAYSSDVTVKLKGTSTSAASGTQTALDIRCYYDDSDASGYSNVTSNITPDASGAWSTYVAASYFDDERCRIRAVPHSYASTDFSAYPAFPTVFAWWEMDIYYTETDSSFGGTPFQYQIYGYGSSAYNDFYNASDAGQYNTELIKTPSLGNTGSSVWDDASYLNYDNSAVAPLPQRASLMVDGHPAYDGYQAWDDLNSNTYDGQSGLTISAAVDPVTGAAVVSESSELVFCAGADGTVSDVVHPSGTQCDHFVPSGVRFTRVHATDGPGITATVRDSFVSKDGKAHTGDVEYIDYVSGSLNDFKFPGDAAFAPVAAGPIATTSWPKAGTELVRYAGGGSPTEDADHPVGALTYSSKPDNVVAVSTTELYQQYSRPIPASGSFTLTRSFSTATTSAAAATLGAAVVANNGPKLVLSPLPATTGTRAVTVTGHFVPGGNGNPATVTANGVSAPVAADGTFSVPLTLSATPGLQSVSVIGTDVIGSVASGTVSTTYANPGGAGAPKVAKTKSAAGKVTKETVTVPVTCAAFAPLTGCKITLKLGAKGKPLAPAKTVTVAPGATVKVQLVLSGAARSAINSLKKGKHLSGNLQTIYADPVGGTLALKVKTVKLA